MKKKELEILLEWANDIPRPKPELEQYRTPAPVAAEVLFGASMRGEVTGRSVLDLGCGSGVLSLGAALLGACKVLAVDKDPDSIAALKGNIEKLDVPRVIEPVLTDVRDLRPEERYDVCFMNPPFGAQNRGADRPFLKKALELCEITYSFHLSETVSFVRRFAEERGGAVVERREYEFRIPHMFSFHVKESAVIDVVCLKFLSPSGNDENEGSRSPLNPL